MWQIIINISNSAAVFHKHFFVISINNQVARSDSSSINSYDFQCHTPVIFNYSCSLNISLVRNCSCVVPASNASASCHEAVSINKNKIKILVKITCCKLSLLRRINHKKVAKKLPCPLKVAKKLPYFNDKLKETEK